jgi:hypothetical protein
MVAKFAMHHLLEEKIVDIAALCRRYHVRRLAVIGSAARGQDFDAAGSDADFLVEFEPANDLSALEQFFGLRADLSGLLERPVDLIESSAVRNPYLLASFNRAREIVYGT